MKYKAPMLVVRDMERSKEFYREVLGLRMTLDFGANITLTGGLSLQTEESWARFLDIPRSDIVYGGKDAEIYFEEAEFDAFIERLSGIDGLVYAHSAMESSWGQRCVRFYDPDGHIIEVGEDLKAVCRRFMDSGMSVAEVAARMDVPEKLIRSCLR